MARRTTNKWGVLLGLTAGTAVLAGTAAALTFAFYAPALPFVLGLSIGGVQLFAFAEALSLPLQVAALSGIAAGAGAVITGTFGVAVNVVTSILSGIASLFSRSSAKPIAEEINDDFYGKANNGNGQTRNQMNGLGAPRPQADNADPSASENKEEEKASKTPEVTQEASNDAQQDSSPNEDARMSM